MSQSPILEVKNLRREFAPPRDAISRFSDWVQRRPPLGAVQAVAGVDLQVNAGEVVGIVGESGCGKSTLGRMLAGILTPSSGDIHFKGQSIKQLNSQARREYELAVQMIFQDPFSSLNPRMRVVDIIGEAPVVHGLIRRADQESYVVGLMERVGLDASTRFRYPHQFSGGQRQRIGVARALALNPTVLVCDEAVAALDVSIQAQVLNLFHRLQKELGLTYLFISHNLGVVSHLADRVMIMYLGKVVEIGDTETIFERPSHPYTQALIKELPKLRMERRDFVPIKGELPSPLNPPSGCAFHPRCPHVMPRCLQQEPKLAEVSRSPEGVAHASACHLNDV